jgi:hypothetical protein
MALVDHMGRPFNTGDGIGHSLLYDHRGNVMGFRSKQDHAFGHAAQAEAKRHGERENARMALGNNPQRHIASIPTEVMNQLMRDGRAPTQDRQAFLKWLDGPGRIWKSYKGSVS